MNAVDQERLAFGRAEWAERRRRAHPEGRGIVLQLADGTSLSPVELAEAVWLRTPVGERFVRMVEAVIEHGLPMRRPREAKEQIQPLSLETILDDLARAGTATSATI